MNREDVRKLLGGYATGTLSAAEREALFAAALDDQALFDALMKEEALREVLEEPGTKAQLLAVLQAPEPQQAWWSWRPLIGAVAMAGIVLAAVAIWRGNKEKPVTVSELSRQAPAPAPVIRPPATIERAETPPSKLPAERKALRDERRQVKAKDRERDNAVPPAAATAPASPPPPAQQQVGQIAPPSPMVQQQAVQRQAPKAAQSVALEAVPVLNRAAGATGFRAASGSKETASDMLMTKKASGPLEWAILRGDAELPPGTPLVAGEALRLRIFSSEPGTLTLIEGDKVLASGTVESAKPFDTPPIPYTAPGLRQFRVSVATGAPQPLTLDITLNYPR